MFNNPIAFRFSTSETKSTAQKREYKLPGKNSNKGTNLAKLKEIKRRSE